MKPTRAGYILAGTIFVALVSFSQPALGLTGEEIIAKTKQSFAKYKSFSARFEKHFYWALLDNRQASQKGRIFTLRPDRFRVELENGDKIVADGQAIWSYSGHNGQVVINSYDGNFRTPWEILINYTDQYRPMAVSQADLDGTPCYELSLEPTKSGSRMAKMKVWIHKKKWHLLKVEQVDVNENVTTYILDEHKTNKKLDDALFRYEPSEGVEVIDRRIADPVG